MQQNTPLARRLTYIGKMNDLSFRVNLNRHHNINEQPFINKHLKVYIHGNFLHYANIQKNENELSRRNYADKRESKFIIKYMNLTSYKWLNMNNHILRSYSKFNQSGIFFAMSFNIEQ